MTNNEKGWLGQNDCCKEKADSCTTYHTQFNNLLHFMVIQIDASKVLQGKLPWYCMHMCNKAIICSWHTIGITYRKVIWLSTQKTLDSCLVIAALPTAVSWWGIAFTIVLSMEVITYTLMLVAIYVMNLIKDIHFHFRLFSLHLF